MKKILLGMMVLASFSIFAQENLNTPKFISETASVELYGQDAINLYEQLPASQDELDSPGLGHSRSNGVATCYNTIAPQCNITILKH